MIHAQEIRIGNCVKDSHGKIRFITHRILSNIASNPGHHGYEPLELNEERLRQFGFVNGGVHDGGEQSWRHPKFPFGINGPNVYYYDDGHCMEFAYVEYVHQLQNLYYAIVGEELEVHNLK